MKRLLALSIIAASVLAAGCATADAPAPVQRATTATKDANEVITGSRLARSTTDRLVKSTVQDKSDEPVRSMGNVVGASGR